MERGFSGGGEPRFSMHAAQEGAAIDRMLDQIAQRATDRLSVICIERQDLHQYAPIDNVRRAQRAIQNLRLTMQKYPQLVAQLRAASQTYPDLVVMAILPEENLVFMQTKDGVEGFAPVLTCTYNAIDDLRAAIHKQGPYGIVMSDNGLIPAVIKKLDADDASALSYKRGSMDPADYVALGAQRLFFNETFRFRLDKRGGIIK